MRTKIVCTIGPASETEDVLRQMIRTGMDVARLNFSHGTHEDHARRLSAIRRIAAEEKARVAVMGDLQGPKFRLGKLPDEGVTLTTGQHVFIYSGAPPAVDGVCLPMPHPEVIEGMQTGRRLLIDDGTFEFVVTRKVSGDCAECEVKNGGVVTSRKGVSLPGAHIDVSSITPKDREDLRFAIEQGVDVVALSFVRRAEDIRELRWLIREMCPDEEKRPYILAKIEKPEAVADITNILKETDIVMVARGDLGVESSPQDVPFFQKQIIRECLRAGKPVITATQMLQSMISAPVPTRAEASDVANAVLDGTDAVMMSAETASGQYPLESVKVMQTICARAESDESMWSDIEIEERERELARGGGMDDVTKSVTNAAVLMANEIDAAAIVCLTSSGYTARMIARHRPPRPIIALTSKERTCMFTAFTWDVQSFKIDLEENVETMVAHAGQLLVDKGVAKKGQRVVFVAGVPLGRGKGTTNLLQVQTL